MIGIVVLNWNEPLKTVRCIESLFNPDSREIIILIIDNGSSPNYRSSLLEYMEKSRGIICESKENLKSEIAKKKANLFLLLNEVNLGFARGANCGLAVFQELGFKWAMTLNNDAVLSSKELNRLITIADQQKNFSIFSPRINELGSDRIWSIGGCITPYYKVRPFNLGWLNKMKGRLIVEVGFLTGCALLLDLKKISAYSDDYFFGEEDVELSIRASRMGLKLAVVPSVVAYHEVSVTINKVSESKWGRVCYYIACRRRTIRKHASLVGRCFLYLLCDFYLIFAGIKIGIDRKSAKRHFIAYRSLAKQSVPISAEQFYDFMKS